MRILFVLAVLVAGAWAASPRETFTGHVSHPGPSAEEKDPDFWRKKAKDEMKVAFDKKDNKNTAKNVILFLGDGMSISTIFGGRVHKGQLKGNPGEEEKLVFENFPNVGLSKTYSVDHQISDSAVTATAYHCGVKSIYATIGVDPRVKHNICKNSKDYRLSCIADMSIAEGKSAGFVTTARLTHASPGPTYLYTANRNWEDDSKLTDEAKQNGCPDMASQLLMEKASGLSVMMGGGRKHLTPNTEADPEYPTKKGNRLDGRNIAKEWLDKKKSEGKKALYAWHRDNLTNANIDEIDYIMGSFEMSHMKYSSDPGAGVDEPTLEEMTETALKVLKRNDKGFFLFVEGAKIDLASHEAQARLTVEEVVEFDKAIAKAMSMTNEEETLIIVTADHSHGISFSSFPTRGNPILGFSDHTSDRGDPLYGEVDNKPFTTASFTHGPGFDDKWEVVNGKVSRVQLTQNDVDKRLFRYASTVDMKLVGHEGGDVGIYARGPWSHLIHTTHEQNYIHHVMAYASCVGDYKNECKNRKKDNGGNNNQPKDEHCGVNKLAYTSGLMILLLVITTLF